MGLKDLDIAPASEDVEIRGGTVTVYGVGVGDLLGIVQRSPALLDALMGDTPDPAALAQAAPEAVGAVIAAATGEAGDPDAVAAAEKLSAGEQLAILRPAVTLTFPFGMTSAAETLAALVQGEPTPAETGTSGA